MAEAKALVNGLSYPVTQGDYKGQEIKVIDNTPLPDNHEHRRKILVETAEGTQIYLLPRQISDGTLTVTQRQEQAIVRQTAPVSHFADAITDPMDPRLDAYRPDPAIVDQYISRQLPGGKKDVDMLLHYWRERNPTLLVGETQSGKTMIVQVIACLAAKEAGFSKPFPVFTLSGSAGITDFDLFGQPTAWTDPDTGIEQIVYLPGLVDMAFRFGGFLYLDEMNLMSERVTSSLHPATDDRRCFINRNKAVKVPGDGFVPEVVNASEWTWVVGTYNDGYRGGSAMNEAFVNRFRHLPWDYDDKVEAKLVASAAVLKIGEAVRTAREQGHVNTPVGTRALENLCTDAYTHGVDFALWAFVGMFPTRDRAAVNQIINDRSFNSALATEVKAHEDEKERQRKIAAGETVDEPEPEPEPETAKFAQSAYPWTNPKPGN